MKKLLIRENRDHGLIEEPISRDLKKCSMAELNILRLMLATPGTVVDKDRLISIGWDGKMVSEPSLPVAITSLRKILEFFGYENAIFNVKGVGYGLSEQVLLDTAPQNKREMSNDLGHPSRLSKILTKWKDISKIVYVVLFISISLVIIVQYNETKPSFKINDYALSKTPFTLYNVNGKLNIISHSRVNFNITKTKTLDSKLKIDSNICTIIINDYMGWYSLVYINPNSKHQEHNLHSVIFRNESLLKSKIENILKESTCGEN